MLSRDFKTLPVESLTLARRSASATLGTTATGIQVSNVSSRLSRAGKAESRISISGVGLERHVLDLDFAVPGLVGHLDVVALDWIAAEERTMNQYASAPNPPVQIAHLRREPRKGPVGTIRRRVIEGDGSSGAA